MTCINMTIWVSKEELGPQDCSKPSYIFNKPVFRAKNWNIQIPHFSFVFFRSSFVYFTEFVGGLNIVQIKKEKFPLSSYAPKTKSPKERNFSMKMKFSQPPNVIYVKYVIYVIYEIYDMYGTVIHHMYICQNRCSKKR